MAFDVYADLSQLAAEHIRAEEGTSNGSAVGDKWAFDSLRSVFSQVARLAALKGAAVDQFSSARYAWLRMI